MERGDIPEFKGLTCRYGDLVTFDHLSFIVAEEWMFGFAGRNGAGKATAMRIMLGWGARHQRRPLVRITHE